MKILAHKNVNLHSASSKGRLIHIANKQTKMVPEDVKDHPAFELLVDDGSIFVIEDKSEIPQGIAELLEKYPDAANHIEEARISGSPLHLVEANLAAKELEKNETNSNDDDEEEDEEEEKDDEEKKDDEKSK